MDTEAGRFPLRSMSSPSDPPAANRPRSSSTRSLRSRTRTRDASSTSSAAHAQEKGEDEEEDDRRPAPVVFPLFRTSNIRTRVSRRTRRRVLLTAALTALCLYVASVWLYNRGGTLNLSRPGGSDGNKDGEFQQHPSHGPGQDNEQEEKMKEQHPNGIPRPPSSQAKISSLPTVKLTQGTYVGITVKAHGNELLKRDIEAFKGIPYGKSTGGRNRFRAPVPLEPDETGVYEGYITNEEVGEDCLDLEVFRPMGTTRDGYSRDGANGERKLLPVALYVHGGGFNGGKASERNMASFVSWSEPDILGLSFNYRVSALGFLSCSLAAKEGVLNLGLRDQQLLFEWTRQNIREFGGDPENVTIMGLSAGAHSVGHHLNYYNSSNAPFNKAILESGTSVARATYSYAHPRHEQQFREFVKLVGLSHVPDSELLDQLRDAPFSSITRASKTIWDQYDKALQWPFQPVIEPTPEEAAKLRAESSSAGPDIAVSSDVGLKTIEDPVIPLRPIDLLRSPTRLQVPLILGFQENEGSLFVPQRHAKLRPYFSALIDGMGEDDLQRLEELYPLSHPDYAKGGAKYGLGKEWPRMEAAYGHYAYICPVVITGHWFAVTWGNRNDSSAPKKTRGETENIPGGDPSPSSSLPWQAAPAAPASFPSSRSYTTAVMAAPIYLYRFAAVRQPWGTANHADEAEYVAHDVRRLGGQSSPGRLRIAEAMNGYWARFIATGDPNPPSTGAATASAKREAKPWKHNERDAQYRQFPIWPKFETPFGPGDGLVEGTEYVGDDPGAGKGRLMLFGAGNNEANGGRDQGVAAQTTTLSKRDVEQCRFWWSRIELSEGMGRRHQQTAGAGKGTKVKAKL